VGLTAPVVTSASASGGNNFADRLGSLTLSGSEAVPAGSNAPDHLIVSGKTDVTVTVTSVGPDDTGTLVVLPVQKASTFALTVTSRSGKTVLSKTSVTIAKGSSTGSVVLRFTGQANGVAVAAKGSGQQKDWTASSAASPVDVALKASASPTSTSFWGTAGATPCTPDKTLGNRLCADLVLPTGVSSDVLLTTGLCDAVLTCGSDKDLVQVLADLTGVTRTTPATLIIKCDKSACPGGGVPSYDVLFSISPDSSVPLSEAPACSSKGVVDEAYMTPDGGYCLDYRQSKRDNAGDLHLYLLFTQDARGSMP
jgi:hypothetical protein